MAIGDTVQAGLLRADFSPIERGGAAKGRAYRAIGEGIGSALDKFAKNKQEGEAAEMGINAMIAGMDDKQKEELLSGETKLGKTYNKFLDGELSNSQKKAFLGGLATYNTTYRQNMADQMALDKFAIQEAEERRRADLYQRGLDRDKQNQIKANIYDKFLGSREMVDMPVGGFDPNPLMRGVPQSTVRVPQGEYKGNRFFQTEQGKSDFTSLVDAGIDESDALEIASKREAQFLASQPKPMSDKELEELIKLRLANQKALKQSELPVLTEGEKVIDELTAKEYSEYVNLGGKSAVQSKIKKLNKAIQDLEGSDDLNSWLTGVLPESMKALFNEKGLSVQQAVESVIQENLRETLGAQFAQKEGEMFMARGYDARLSDEDNIERVKSLLKEIEDRASARTQTFDYFKKNKTMKGYDGPVFNESIKPSPSSSFDPQEIDRLYEEKMRLGKARGLR